MSNKFILSNGKFVTSGGKLVVQAPEITDCLVLTAEEANSTVKLKQARNDLGWVFSYSMDHIHWLPYSPDMLISLPKVGSYVCFRGEGNDKRTTASQYDYYYFSFYGTISASGNCNRLLDYNSDKTTNYCFYRLFYYTRLTKAPNLLATNLSQGCYREMFGGCTLLTSTPRLPAVTMSSHCYSQMFQDCKSLKTITELPATTLGDYCYSSMFNGCTSLTSAPELPVMSVNEGSYFSMFKGCTSLTTAPELPATTINSYSYQHMFEGCASLTQAPTVLPSLSFSEECYSQMFKGCSSLERSPQILAVNNVSKRCCDNMFYGCSNLNYIKLSYLGTFSPSDTSGDLFSFYQWVYNVSSTGDIYYNGVDRTVGISAIPTGWTLHFEQYAYNQENNVLNLYNTQYTQNNTEVNIY